MSLLELKDNNLCILSKNQETLILEEGFSVSLYKDSDNYENSESCIDIPDILKTDTNLVYGNYIVNLKKENIYIYDSFTKDLYSITNNSKKKHAFIFQFVLYLTTGDSYHLITKYYEIYTLPPHVKIRGKLYNGNFIQEKYDGWYLDEMIDNNLNQDIKVSLTGKTFTLYNLFQHRAILYNYNGSVMNIFEDINTVGYFGDLLYIDNNMYNVINEELFFITSFKDNIENANILGFGLLFDNIEYLDASKYNINIRDLCMDKVPDLYIFTGVSNISSYKNCIFITVDNRVNNTFELCQKLNEMIDSLNIYNFSEYSINKLFNAHEKHQRYIQTYKISDTIEDLEREYQFIDYKQPDIDRAIQTITTIDSGDILFSEYLMLYTSIFYQNNYCLFFISPEFFKRLESLFNRQLENSEKLIQIGDIIYFDKKYYTCPSMFEYLKGYPLTN